MNSSICVDAKIVIWALTPALLRDQSKTILRDCRRADVGLAAPAHPAFEVTSVLRLLVHLGDRKELST